MGEAATTARVVTVSATLDAQLLLRVFLRGRLRHPLPLGPSRYSCKNAPTSLWSTSLQGWALLGVAHDAGFWARPHSEHVPYWKRARCLLRKRAGNEAADNISHYLMGHGRLQVLPPTQRQGQWKDRHLAKPANVHRSLHQICLLHGEFLLDCAAGTLRGGIKGILPARAAPLAPSPSPSRPLQCESALHLPSLTCTVICFPALLAMPCL